MLSWLPLTSFCAGSAVRPLGLRHTIRFGRQPKFESGRICRILVRVLRAADADWQRYFEPPRSPDVGNLIQDITVGTVDQQYAVVDPDPAAVIGRPGQAIGPVVIHDIAHEIARQIFARMPAMP